MMLTWYSIHTNSIHGWQVFTGKAHGHRQHTNDRTGLHWLASTASIHGWQVFTGKANGHRQHPRLAGLHQRGDTDTGKPLIWLIQPGTVPARS